MMRERLIELLMQKGFGVEGATIAADHLLANGVIVPPCKVGDTVWYEMCGEIESAVIYFCRGDLTSRGFVITDAKAKSEHGLEVSFGEKSIGKKVFLTREEAELEWDTVKKSQNNLNRR